MTTRYKVIGPNSLDGAVECWHFPTREAADEFASFTAGNTGYEYAVAVVVGEWRRPAPPVEWVPVEDADADA